MISFLIQQLYLRSTTTGPLPVVVFFLILIDDRTITKYNILSVKVLHKIMKILRSVSASFVILP